MLESIPTYLILLICQAVCHVSGAFDLSSLFLEEALQVPLRILGSRNRSRTLVVHGTASHLGDQ
jgi:hypothetical protein